MDRTVGVTELRWNLGRYARRVSEGERLLVTNGGQPMAEFVPLSGIDADEALIEEATRRLSAAAPDSEVVLFGLRVGQARGDGELALVVIAPDFGSRGREAARLRMALRGLDVAVDLVLYRRGEAEERRGVPGSFLFHALREGRLLIKA